MAAAPSRGASRLCAALAHALSEALPNRSPLAEHPPLDLDPPPRQPSLFGALACSRAPRVRWGGRHKATLPTCDGGLKDSMTSRGLLPLREMASGGAVAEMSRCRTCRIVSNARRRKRSILNGLSRARDRGQSQVGGGVFVNTSWLSFRQQFVAPAPQDTPVRSWTSRALDSQGMTRL